MKPWWHEFLAQNCLMKLYSSAKISNFRNKYMATGYTLRQLIKILGTLSPSNNFHFVNDSIEFWEKWIYIITFSPSHLPLNVHLPFHCGWLIDSCGWPIHSFTNWFTLTASYNSFQWPLRVYDSVINSWLTNSLSNSWSGLASFYNLERTEYKSPCRTVNCPLYFCLLSWECLC
jgi:hypothetical protein